MSGTIYYIDEAAKREFDRIRRLVDSIRGPGVTRTPETITIGWPPIQRMQEPTGDDSNTTIVSLATASNWLPGSQTSSASGGYTATDYHTAATMGSFTPIMQRVVGLTKPATIGTLTRNSEGTLVLFWCDEIPDTGPCVEPSDVSIDGGEVPA